MKFASGFSDTSADLLGVEYVAASSSLMGRRLVTEPAYSRHRRPSKSRQSALLVMLMVSDPYMTRIAPNAVKGLIGSKRRPDTAASGQR